MCVNMKGLSTMTTGNGHADHDHAEFSEDVNAAAEGHEGMVGKAVATVAVVAVGAALFEVALLPGIALGAAAVAAPKYLPKLGNALNPLFKSTVRGSYKLAQKSKEMFHEAREHVNDAVAEVKAEAGSAANGAATHG
jgi:hypothetical protein